MNSFYLKTNNLEILNKVKITKIALKEFNNKPLIKLNQDKIIKLLEELKITKTRVGYLDFDNETNSDYENIINITKMFSANHIFLKMPLITNFEEEKDQLIADLSETIKIFKKEKIKISFHLDYQINSAKVAYIITKIKEINFVFDSAKCFSNNKSISSYYRLLKDRIDILIVNDVNDKFEPTLMLYGKAQLKEMQERLKFDNFKGDIIYDFNLEEYLDNRSALYKKRLPFLRGKLYNSHLFIEEKLNLTKDSEVSYDELFINQFSLINKIFK